MALTGGSRFLQFILGGKYTGEPAVQKASTDLDGLQKAVSGVAGKLIGGLGLAFGLAEATRALKGFGQSQAAYIAESGDFADQLDISVESLSRFHHVARVNGIQVDQINNSLQRGQRAWEDYVFRGTGPAARVFAEMNLEAFDANGKLRNIADILPEVADYFAQLSDGRVEKAFAIFEAEGVKNLRFLADGGAALKAALGESDRIGATVTREQADTVREFAASWERFKGSVEALARPGAVAAMDTLSGLINALTGYHPEPLITPEEVQLYERAAAAASKVRGEPGANEIPSDISFEGVTGFPPSSLPGDPDIAIPSDISFEGATGFPDGMTEAQFAVAIREANARRAANARRRGGFSQSLEDVQGMQFDLTASGSTLGELDKLSKSESLIGLVDTSEALRASIAGLISDQENAEKANIVFGTLLDTAGGAMDTLLTQFIDGRAEWDSFADSVIQGAKRMAVELGKAALKGFLLRSITSVVGLPGFGGAGLGTALIGQFAGGAGARQAAFGGDLGREQRRAALVGTTG